jgi:hypothetical protein
MRILMSFNRLLHLRAFIGNPVQRDDGRGHKEKDIGLGVFGRGILEKVSCDRDVHEAGDTGLSHCVAFLKQASYDKGRFISDSSLGGEGGRLLLRDAIGS